MSRIIIPGETPFYIARRRYVEVESTVSVGVEGFFTGRAIKPGVGVTREFGMRVPTKNLLTNLGMDALGGSSPGFTFLHLGTGTNPPEVTNTGLGNFGVSITSGTDTAGNSGEPPYYAYRSITWSSTVGGATGNWTEIGVSSQTTNGGLRSRALIQDHLGQPTVFPVQSDEQFQGTYEFRLYPFMEDFPAEITLGSSTYNTVTRVLNAASSSGVGAWLPGIRASVPSFSPSSTISGARHAWYSGGLADQTAPIPLGSTVGAQNNANTSTGHYTYQAGSFQLDFFVRSGSGASVGQLKTQRITLNSGSLQVEYDPVINKLSTEEVIHNQRVSWARR